MISQSCNLTLRHDAFEPTSSIVPPPFTPPPALLVLDADVLKLDIENVDSFVSDALVVERDECAFGITVVLSITSEVVVAAALADRIEVI